MEATDRRLKALEILGVKRGETHGATPVRHKSKSVKHKFKGESMIPKKLNYRMCLKKKRYRSQAEARRVARSAMRFRGQKLHCYFCGLCGGYHLTKRGFNSANSGRVF